MAAFAQQVSAVRDAMRRKLAAIHVYNRDFAGARQGQVPSARIDDCRHVAEFDRAVDWGFEVRLLVELRRAANVEGSHRQLCARLTDRLGSNDAYCFADVDRSAARE